MSHADNKLLKLKLITLMMISFFIFLHFELNCKLKIPIFLEKRTKLRF